MSRKRRELRQLLIDGSYEVDAAVDLQGTWGGARKGAGRPKTAPDTKTISVRLPMSMVPLITARAASCGQSVSSWLVELIKFDLQID